jgi:hypothetical protein
VTLGGGQVSITRPRRRSADRSSEVQLPTYQAASSTELLGRQAMAKMLAKLSTPWANKAAGSTTSVA